MISSYFQTTMTKMLNKTKMFTKWPCISQCICLQFYRRVYFFYCNKTDVVSTETTSYDLIINFCSPANTNICLSSNKVAISDEDSGNHENVTFCARLFTVVVKMQAFDLKCRRIVQNQNHCLNLADYVIMYLTKISYLLLTPTITSMSCCCYFINNL